jgi:hypothetical protein
MSDYRVTPLHARPGQGPRVGTQPHGSHVNAETFGSSLGAWSWERHVRASCLGARRETVQWRVGDDVRDIHKGHLQETYPDNQDPVSIL